MKVRVRAPYQVNYDGKNHTDGDTLDLPDPDAERLIRQGLVEKVKGRSGPRHAARKPPEPVEPEPKKKTAKKTGSK